MMKKLMLLFVTMSISAVAFAKNDKFDQCVLSLINASCNTAIDRGAPPNLQSQGADACYIGREIAPADSDKKKRFENLIEKRNLVKNPEQSAAIKKCIATPASLKSCSLPLIVATRDYYPVCKEAIEHSEKGKKSKKSKGKS
jgi:hypothetical protein